MDQAYKLAMSDAVGVLFADFEKDGLLGFGLTTYAALNCINSTKPVKCLADLKNLKVRTTRSEQDVAMAKALGMSPVVIPYPEQFSSLQRGVIQATLNGPSVNLGAGVYEVSKHVLVTQHQFGWHAFLVNKKWFNKLPQQFQEIVRISAREGCFEELIDFEDKERTLLEETLPKMGVTVTWLPEKEKAVMNKNLKSVHSIVEREVGKQFIVQVYKIVGISD
jgi:TRAP-type C4-dicarboxylate transport system substrate-binding protein